MTNWLRSAVVPAYILLCLVLGGSGQGLLQNAVLQLIAVVIIGWALLARQQEPLTGAAKSLLAIAGVTVLLVAAHLVPLPPALWSALPGRDFIAEGFRLLGQPLPWLPLSLAPYDTMATALTLLPPVAVVVAMLRASSYRPSWLALAILVGTFAAVLLGALQVGSADAANSPWYLFERTNHGVATGFFANSNHMASLLVISVPILFALVQRLRERAGDAKATSAILLLAVSGVLVLLVGIVLNQSLAVLLLGPPVLLISASMLLPARLNWRKPLWGLALVGAVAMLFVYITPLHGRLGASNTTSLEGRQFIWMETMPAVADFMPVGSGIGTYADIYQRYEDPLTVIGTYVNHAHNDYLEIAVEAGLPGIVLLLAFLLWWGRRSVTIWRAGLTDRYAQAATIASAALLLHSFVDYPLRTAALSAIMAAFVAIMAQPRSRQRDSAPDLWPTRHVTV